MNQSIRIYNIYIYMFSFFEGALFDFIGKP